jgi:K+-transporting ATPase KdpF subunit
VDVRLGGTGNSGGVLRVRLVGPLGAREDLMSASDIFGLVVTIAVFLYLVYALLRGERL